MKTQRILGVLWFVMFSFILSLWFWQFMEQTVPYPASFRALASPVIVFGAVASLYLCRGARWARVTVGVIAAFIAGLAVVELWESNFSRYDGYLGVFALASVVLLFWPRRELVS